VDRRKFIRNVSGLTVLSLFTEGVLEKALADNRVTAKKIIIRSTWSIDSIGDRIYLPAIFKYIQMNVPGAEIYFWPYLADEPVLERIKANIQKFHIITGEIRDSGKPETAELFTHLDSADLVIHTGGIIAPGFENNPAHLFNSNDTLNYCLNKGILFGIHSLRFPNNFIPDEKTIKILNDSSFAFISTPYNEKAFVSAGVKNKNAGYSPDADFYYDLSDENMWSKYIYSIGYSGQDYLVLPLRRSDLLTGNLDLDKQIVFYRNIIDSWISETGNSVIIIPGDSRDIQYFKDTFLTELKEEFRKKAVVMDNLSDPGQILSIIDKSRLCVGNDPGSSMLAISSKVPIIYVTNQPEDQFSNVLKSLSLGHRIFDVTSLTQDDMVKMIFDIHKNYVNAMLEVDHAMKDIINEALDSLKIINSLLKGKIQKNKKEEKAKKP
jgi:hypothetical protein